MAVSGVDVAMSGILLAEGETKFLARAMVLNLGITAAYFFSTGERLRHVQTRPTGLGLWLCSCLILVSLGALALQECRRVLGRGSVFICRDAQAQLYGMEWRIRPGWEWCRILELATCRGRC